jgi:hypothetical protein
MYIKELAPERLAEFFHHYNRALEVFGKAGESDSWQERAESEKNPSEAAACLILLQLDLTKDESENSRRYFAKPGEAEWGC